MAETGGLFVIDAETGDTSQFTTTINNGSGTFTATAGSKLHGNYGFNVFNPTVGSSAYLYGQKDFTGPQTELYLRFYHKFANVPVFTAYGQALTLWVGDSKNVYQTNEIFSLMFRELTGGTSVPISIYYRGSGITSGDYANTFDTNVHYYEVHWKKDASAGVFQIWKDGAQIVNQTGLNTSAYSAVSCWFGSGSTSQTADYTVYIDDFKVATTGPIGAYPPTSIFSEKDHMKITFS